MNAIAHPIRQAYRQQTPPKAVANPQRKKVRILSIDGGGMRGIIPATVIWHLEQRLQEKTGNPDARISDYFDLLAGTSTGGILACTYLIPDSERPGRPKFDARQSLAMYLDNRGCGIFARSWFRKLTSLMGLIDEKYCSGNLEKALKKCLGGQVRLSSFLKPCLITAYDIKNRRAKFFTSVDAQSDSNQDYKAWEAARATAAAPSYFQPACLPTGNNPEEVLVDGGVFANNPALCAFTEAQKTCFAQRSGDNSRPDHPGQQDMIIVSLGTGDAKKGYALDEVKSQGMVKWAKPIIDILMGASTDTADYQLQQLFDTKEKENGGRYYRLNPQLKGVDNAMDNIRPAHLKSLHQLALQYIRDNEEMLEEIVDQLMENS
ncbi:MAG: patatin-like phospholipase family protein [Lewinellaceae bacterium]|nr:patatin-like phospholipase family protein [Lewinellaceae bacterium]